MTAALPKYSAYCYDNYGETPPPSSGWDNSQFVVSIRQFVNPL
jgi:hypothetical protein